MSVECALVLAAFLTVGIDEEAGRLVIGALGIESVSDVAFIRDLKPKFLMYAVERGSMALTAVRALRVCKKLAVLPNVGARSSAGLEELLHSFGAVAASVEDPSNKLLGDVALKELYVPTYPVLVVRRLRRLNEFARQVDVGFTVVLRFNFQGLPTKMNELIVDRLMLRLNDVPLRVKDTEHSVRWVDNDRSVLMLVVRLTLEDLPFTAHSYDTSDWEHYADYPFDRPILNVHLELLPFVLTTSNVLEACDDTIAALDQWQIRFNLHRFVFYSHAKDDSFCQSLPRQTAQYMNKNAQLKINEEANKILNFDILQNLTSIAFPLKDQKTYYTPAVHFTLPIIRHPGAAMRWGVLPLLALNLGTLSTLFMNDVGENYNDRLMNLITLMVALFAFLGFARSSMPDVPVSTWIDRALLRSTIMAMSVMLESLVAFLTARGASSGLLLSSNYDNRAGAFHYFMTFRPTFRDVARCFGIGLPLVAIQVQTILSLWFSYRRFTQVLHLDTKVYEAVAQNTRGRSNLSDLFSRRQYMHPKVCDDNKQQRHKSSNNDSRRPQKKKQKKYNYFRRKILAAFCSKNSEAHHETSLDDDDDDDLDDDKDDDDRDDEDAAAWPSSPSDKGGSPPRTPSRAFRRFGGRETAIQRQARELRNVLEVTRAAQERASLDSAGSDDGPTLVDKAVENFMLEESRRNFRKVRTCSSESDDNSENEQDTVSDLPLTKTNRANRRKRQFQYSLDDRPMAMDTVPDDA